MIRWFLRGVTRRRLTTPYPKAEELAPAAFRAYAVLAPDAISRADAVRCVEVCLPGALSLDDRGRLGLDAGRCIGCGLCADIGPAPAVTMHAGYEVATSSRARLVLGDEIGEAERSAVRLGGSFRRSLHIRHIDTGSDGAVEQEIAALMNPYYDMQRLGMFFTASPRHADVLLVTGPVTVPMAEPLRRTFEAMPEPRVVIAAGTDACSGGIWTEPEVRGGVDRVLPVDVYIPGDPPNPIALLHGLLLASGRAKSAAGPSAQRAHSIATSGGAG